jgi:opacity protein-like surface antigen
MRRILLFALLLAGAAPAAAQNSGTGELTPTIGYRFGGSLRDAATGESFSIRPSWSWGFVAGLAPGSPNLIIEGTYLQQLTRASGENTFAGGEGNLHDMRIQTVLAGVQWDFSPKARTRPFVSAGVGATSLEAQGGGRTTSFTASLAGGLKLMTSPGFGLRLHLRALAMLSGSSTTDLCHFSDCHVALPGGGTVQVDLSLGTLFGF